MNNLGPNDRTSGDAVLRRPTTKLAARSSFTLTDLLANPDQLVCPADLASLGIVGSYTTLWRWLKKGEFPQPIPMPGNRKRWMGREILTWLHRDL